MTWGDADKHNICPLSEHRRANSEAADGSGGFHSLGRDEPYCLLLDTGSRQQPGIKDANVLYVGIHVVSLC
jgi:hypothetical protein